MAFNWQTFKTRTLTAILFAVVMLVGLLWNRWSFFILFSIIHFGCWWEYLRLMEKIHAITFNRYTKLGFMLIGFAIILWFCGPGYEINNYSFRNNFSFPVSIAGVVLLAFGIFQSKQINLKSFGAAALGLLYISLSWGLMMGLYATTDFYVKGNFTTEIHISNTMFVVTGNFIPIVIIASIWINDTMAYIIGSLLGKTPMSKISPKKTWEGTIGGIILSVIVTGTIAFLWIDEKVFTIFIIILSSIVAITGTFGDFFESKLKRMANVKDSGHIMPGHGGFLDRFDSLLLAIPAVWLFVYFFMR